MQILCEFVNFDITFVCIRDKQSISFFVFMLSVKRSQLGASVLNKASFSLKVVIRNNGETLLNLACVVLNWHYVSCTGHELQILRNGFK